MVPRAKESQVGHICVLDWLICLKWRWEKKKASNVW
jgi:hypothetical protein